MQFFLFAPEFQRLDRNILFSLLFPRWAAPSRLEYVTPAFLDEERTDEACVVNDLNECPTAWETLNIGSGAFMHEGEYGTDKRREESRQLNSCLSFLFLLSQWVMLLTILIGLLG